MKELTKEQRETHQAFLARDIISMIRSYGDNADILEYLEGLTVSIGFMMKKEDYIVNWLDISSVCDQRYYSIKIGKPRPLDTEMLDECEKKIQPFLPKEVQD